MSFSLKMGLLAASLPHAAVALRGPVGCCRRQPAVKVTFGIHFMVTLAGPFLFTLPPCVGATPLSISGALFFLAFCCLFVRSSVR